MPLCVCCLLSSRAQAAMSDSSSSGCKDSFLPQEGRPAQSGLFWSVSSQSDYIRQLLWRLDSLLLPFLHYGASMCGSSSSSWAFLPHSRPGPVGAAEAGPVGATRPHTGPWKLHHPLTKWASSLRWTPLRQDMRHNTHQAYFPKH